MSVIIETRAVLLDMDGTLVDSSAVVERLWCEWADRHALDRVHVLSVIHGRQSLHSIRLLLPERPLPDAIEDNRVMTERETAEVEGIVPIAGAAELMRSLASVPHALVTSASVPLASARMTAAGLEMPAVAVTAEGVSASKPDPEGFLTAAAALGVPVDECVVLEDSAAGIAAAHQAGMRVIGIGAAAACHGADWTVADLSEVQVTTAGSTVLISLAPLS